MLAAVDREFGRLVAGLACRSRRSSPARSAALIRARNASAHSGRVPAVTAATAQDCARCCRCATMSTPSSRSGASAAPSARCPAAGSDRSRLIATSGMSAAGNIGSTTAPGAVVEAPIGSPPRGRRPAGPIDALDQPGRAGSRVTGSRRVRPEIRGSRGSCADVRRRSNGCAPCVSQCAVMRGSPGGAAAPAERLPGAPLGHVGDR